MKSESALDACNQLTNRFFFLLDEGRYDDLIGLMQPDAVWHRQGRHLHGHAEIRAALDERSPTQRIRHVITNGFIADENNDSIRYLAYMIGYRYDDGVTRQPPLTIPGPLRMLLVETWLARQSDGRWLIRETAAIPEFEFANSLAGAT